MLQGGGEVEKVEGQFEERRLVWTKLLKGQTVVVRHNPWNTGLLQFLMSTKSRNNEIDC
jgi:hypothetical protein